jgi:hypothetical protein
MSLRGSLVGAVWRCSAPSAAPLPDNFRLHPLSLYLSVQLHAQRLDRVRRQRAFPRVLDRPFSQAGLSARSDEKMKSTGFDCILLALLMLRWRCNVGRT